MIAGAYWPSAGTENGWKSPPVNWPTCGVFGAVAEAWIETPPTPGQRTSRAYTCSLIPDALLSRYASSANVGYALEINGGRAGELGISAGDVVQLQ